MSKFCTTSLVILLLSAVVAHAASIPLVNGGFEDKSIGFPYAPAGWGTTYAYGSAPDMGVLDVGSYAAWESVTLDGTTLVCRMAESGGNGAAIEQFVSHDWAEGNTYTVAFDFLDRSNTWSGFYILIGSVYDGGSTNVVHVESYGPADMASYAWESHSFEFTADSSVAGDNQLIIRIGFHGASADLDNIHVSYVPEPATMGLLGLGSLAGILVRNRK